MGPAPLPPHSGLSSHFSFSALPCRNVSWDESEQDFQAAALLHSAPTTQQAKMPTAGVAPFKHLEGSPSDSLDTPWYCLFLNPRIIENIKLERTSGGLLVHSPAQSFIIRSGCLRSRPVELLRISTVTLGHLFPCPITFAGKNFFKPSHPIRILPAPISLLADALSASA